MSAYRSLELILRDILQVIKPSRDDWTARFHIIEEIRSVVQSVESLRGATVEPFGSFVSNLFTRWGDLDISIELSNGSYISAAGRKHKQCLLADVLKALRKKGGWRRLQFISNARVPILKFENFHKNISCDISINNLNGQMKSKMLFWINEIDGRFREMVLLVKEWAKANSINDSKSGTLNSYSLCLLIIFHLQTCQPAILPPLKEIYPGNMINELTGVRSAAEKLIEETCTTNINRYKSDRSRKINPISLSDLFISFLAKFCDINLKAAEMGISPYNGHWEAIENNKIWLPKTYALFVEDPFEQPVNTARSVSSRQLTRISEAFQRTHQLLMSSNQTQASLIASLVKHDVFNIMARTVVGKPSSNGRGYPAAPVYFVGTPRNNGVDFVRPPPQLQGSSSTNSRTHSRHYPNRNPGSNRREQLRPSSQAPAVRNAPGHILLPHQLVHATGVNRPPSNVTTPRPPQASHAQVQQRWRPRGES